MEAEAKSGYKMTEVGLIPIDWEVVSINDIIQDNRTIRYGIVQPGTYDPNGRFLVRGQDYSKGWAEPISFFRVSPNIEERYKNARLEEYDLVLTIVGASTGHVEIVPKWLNGANITQTTARIPIEKTKANPFFVMYYLHSSSGLLQIANYLKGAAQPGLNIGDIRTFKVFAPPLPEQTEIANALKDTDDLINSLESLIAKKKLIKQGAMQELLKPKEGWVKKKLGEVARITMGQSPLSKFYNHSGDGLPLVQGNADIQNRKTIVRTYTSNITKKGNEGEIIMSVRAPVGEISKATFDCCLGRGVCSINYKNDYLYHYLIYFEKSWAKLSTGSTFDSVNSSQVNDLEIPIPFSENEQEEIAKVLSDLDIGIESLEVKLFKLQTIKQGMMQQLLTGKIRII
jgi:type I restriction enzyme S subunit